MVSMEKVFISSYKRILFVYMDICKREIGKPRIDDHKKSQRIIQWANPYYDL